MRLNDYRALGCDCQTQPAAALGDSSTTQTIVIGVVIGVITSLIVQFLVGGKGKR